MYIFIDKEKMFYRFYFRPLPETLRLLHANKPAHWDLACLRLYRMAPMKPRTPKNIPKDEVI
jgi:hypothetical protein